MYVVYVIKSLRDKKYYIGHTADIKKRLEEHNRGKNQSLKYRGPFQLIYLEEYSDRLAASRRELDGRAPHVLATHTAQRSAVPVPDLRHKSG